MGKVDYSRPDPEKIEKLKTASDAELTSYLENAKRKLPDTQWFVDKIVEEQTRRGGIHNMNAHSVRDVIVKFAKVGETVTYKQVADALGVSWEQAHWRLPEYLGQACEMERSLGRPLISAIVVSQEGKCGTGFFQMAKSLGIVFNDEQKYQDQEQQRVFDYWKNVKSRLPS